jgi:hypothetical protein
VILAKVLRLKPAEAAEGGVGEQRDQQLADAGVAEALREHLKEAPALDAVADAALQRALLSLRAVLEEGLVC